MCKIIDKKRNNIGSKWFNFFLPKKNKEKKYIKSKLF